MVNVNSCTSVGTEGGNKPVGMEDKQLLRTFMAESATAAGVGISSQAEREINDLV